jgi:hypothetical protein
MKLNLDMAKKQMYWHTLATKLLFPSNGIVLLQMKLNLGMAIGQEATGLAHAGH